MEMAEETLPVSTEEAVQAFLDYLVDPLLPIKYKLSEKPSLDHQKSVAKQVHAVVLLYNYYHRKLHPDLEFLTFDSFCKLAVMLKPALMAYMELMHQSDYSKLNDVESHLSLTEKAVMNACDISRILDASKCNPPIEGWPITKVAVFLMDSRMENCFLLQDNLTQGVWSAIDIDLLVPHISSEDSVERKYLNKRRRTFKKNLTDDQSTEVNTLQQLAFGAVKEVAGIDQNDIMILESRVAYSLGKEMAATCFYLMKSKRSTSDLRVPIKDIVQSLQGPLVKKISSDLMVTSVVEYFHLLPYAYILTDWNSRAVLLNSSHDLVADGYGHVNNSHGANNSCMAEEGKDNSGGSYSTAGPMRNEESNAANESIDKMANNGNQTTYLPNQVEGSPVHSSQIRDQSQRFNNVVEIHHQRIDIPSAEITKLALKIGSKPKVDLVKLSNSGCRNVKIITEQNNAISSSVLGGKPAGDHDPVESQSESQYLRNLQVVLASREKELSQTALRALYRKREKLSFQMRNLQDEVALCDKSIQTILNGGENSLALKIDAVIEGFNDVCLKGGVEKQNNLHNEWQDSSQCEKKKLLCEGVLASQNPCQKLDEICHRNNWILPTYRVHLSDGGYEASVTLKGADFEYSIGGSVSPSPREARESSSENMISKLQQMATQSQ